VLLTGVAALMGLLPIARALEAAADETEGTAPLGTLFTRLGRAPAS